MSSNDDAVLKRNILALSSHNTQLSVSVSETASSKNCSFQKSKKGEIIPVYSFQGRKMPLHSTFDPIREGMRFSQNYPDGGYIVFFGFGGGYHILPFLQRNEVSQIIIIDKGIDLFRSVLEKLDCKNLILDPRVTFLIDYKPEEIRDYILSHYFPAVNGNLQTILLRSRVHIDQEYFAMVTEEIKKSISTLSDDYTVQAHFGRKWFKNTLANLKSAQETTTTLPPISRAIVTGAGPSLEVHISEIKTERLKAFLIATDTSLPCLMQYGIIPDCVISIDCQQVSYNHFLSGIPSHIPLILDLASPPDLTKLTKKLVFFSSGHPFSKYVNAHWRKFPFIDTSGGNVSHAAISLADILGARETILYGADFSYPEGKSYARGTYLYPYFQTRENRVSSLESQFFSFLLRNQNIVQENTGSFIRYTTKPMISYKERLENAVLHLKGRLIHKKGNGVSIKTNNNKKPVFSQTGSFPMLFAAGSPKHDWKYFLQKYERDLKDLPDPVKPFTSYFFNLTAKQQDIWTTLFPAVAAFRQEQINNSIEEMEIIKKVLEWSINIVFHYRNKM